MFIGLYLINFVLELNANYTKMLFKFKFTVASYRKMLFNGLYLNLVNASYTEMLLHLSYASKTCYGSLFLLLIS